MNRRRCSSARPPGPGARAGAAGADGQNVVGALSRIRCSYLVLGGTMRPRPGARTRRRVALLLFLACGGQSRIHRLADFPQPPVLLLDDAEYVNGHLQSFSVELPIGPAVYGNAECAALGSDLHASLDGVALRTLGG